MPPILKGDGARSLKGETMQIRPMAAASALALTGALALSACSGGPRPAAGPATPVITASAAGNQPAGSRGTTAAQADVTVAPTPAVSAAQLSELDQGLSDATGSLGAADQDVTHNETGDANP
jgi:hypothetical protein